MPGVRRNIGRSVPSIVWLSQPALAQMVDEASAKAPFETGGILIGYRGEGSREPVITHVIGPGPLAIHERTAFLPDQHFHVERVKEIYHQSDRRLSYLGDWHTHPDGTAHLSARDKATLLKIAQSEKARAPQPVMLVLAPGPIWSPNAWIGQVTKRHIWKRATVRTRRATVNVFTSGLG